MRIRNSQLDSLRPRPPHICTTEQGPRTLLRRLQFEAPTREAELFDAITEFSSAMGQVRALEAALAEEAGGTSALDHGLHTILDAANETLREVSASSQWSTSIAIDDGGGGGGAGGVFLFTVTF